MSQLLWSSPNKPLCITHSATIIPGFLKLCAAKGQGLSVEKSTGLFDEYNEST